MIIELSKCGYIATVFESADDSEKLESDLLDCTGPGNAEDACQYILDQWKPQFRIVKLIDGRYRNVIASDKDKQEICESIYFDSDTDFSDTDNSELYIVWETAHQFANELPQNR